MTERASILGRMFLVLGLVMILPCAIIFQIIRIQFTEGENLRALWNRQAIDFIPIPAQRGDILDARGRLLVTNSVRHRLALDPLVPGLTGEQKNRLFRTLADFTGKTPAYYHRRVNSAPQGSRYVVLERSLDQNVYEAVRTLNIRGVILEENYRRKYNYGSLAGHALGYVNHELRGMTGLEASHDNLLRGTEGLQQVRRDRSNRIRAIVGAPRKKPRQGHTVQTTIDAQIQAIVEDELKKGIKNTRSNYGTAIILDPKTGAVRAMANYPTYDPNSPAAREGENRRNYAISDMIEPGSTFKLITGAAAVEQGAILDGEIFETPANGQKRIHGQWMRDHNPLGNLTFDQAIIKSSNIVTSEIALRLQPEVLYQYARNMGFGTSTKVGLPNEESGRLRRPYEWSPVSLPWISIGYEVQVTPLQIAQAYGAFANDGVLMQPYIVDRILDENGRTLQQNRPKRVRRVVQSETVARLKPVFQAVVSDSGTARAAQVEGLTIAGKTGTSQKYIDGQYRQLYRSSFVGFYPAENPRYVCLVILDEPRTSYYGGYTAGPIFRNITERIAGMDQDLKLEPASPKPVQERHLAGVPNVKGFSPGQAEVLLRSAGYLFVTEGSGELVTSQFPGPGEKLGNKDRIRLILGDAKAAPEIRLISENHNVVPDVRGTGMRRALYILKQAGYEVRVTGSGTVYDQFPEPGAQYVKGRTVTIRGRTRPMTHLISQNKTPS